MNSPPTALGDLDPAHPHFNSRVPVTVGQATHWCPPGITVRVARSTTPLAYVQTVDGQVHALDASGAVPIPPMLLPFIRARYFPETP